MTAALPEIVLASASPRRRELIALLGVPYRVEQSLYAEPPPPATAVSLPDLVTEMASNKAAEVAQRLGRPWVLGADTLVSLDEHFGVPLGKPVDEADAARMLALLSGRSHYVYTGIAVVPAWSLPRAPHPMTSVAKTRVTFRNLTPAMIADYVATGEPLDKAGAYGAQGFASPFIEAFQGDYFNVVGLPLCELGRLLERAGFDWLAVRASHTAECGAKLLRG